MVQQQVAKTRGLVSAVGILAVLTLLREAFAPIAPRMEPDILLLDEEMGQASGSFEKLPLEGEQDRDEIVLKNGDSLSGKVLGIRDGILSFQADMAEGEIRAPVANLESVFFRKDSHREYANDTHVQHMSGEVALAEGGRFAATILRMDEEQLFFSLACSPDSAEMALGRDKIASLAFTREPLILLKADFSDAKSSPFAANEGEWFVHNGRFLQSDPSQHNATAYVRVKQEGLMRYSWTVHKSDWGHAGVYILSSGEKPGNGGKGYRIHLEHDRLVLYKTEERGESQVFWCPVAPGMTVARVEVLVNCPARRMQIWLSGREIAHLRDTGSPLEAGDYVVLLAVGRAAFDDVQIEQFGADATIAQEEAGKDILMLKNGDRVVGKATQISGDKLVVTDAFSTPSRSTLPTTQRLMIGREKVLRVVCSGRTSAPAKRPQVIFQGGTRLHGAARSLANDVLEVENPVLGCVRFHVSEVKCILF